MTRTHETRGPRSVVYLSGDRGADARRLEIGRPDAVIIDLESPPRSRLDAARSALTGLCQQLVPLVPIVAVRVNGIDDAESPDDLTALAMLPATIVAVLPKPVTHRALADIALYGGSRPIWCMGEETALTDRIGELSASCPRLEAVVIGTYDLSISLGVAYEPDSAVLRAAANGIRAAAQDAGLWVIDGIALGDAAKVAAAARRAREEGFDGVSLGRIDDAALVETAYLGTGSEAAL